MSEGEEEYPATVPGTRKEVRYKCPVEEKINESQVHVTAESKDDSGEEMEKTWWKLGEVVGSKKLSWEASAAGRDDCVGIWPSALEQPEFRVKQKKKNITRKVLWGTLAKHCVSEVRS